MQLDNSLIRDILNYTHQNLTIIYMHEEKRLKNINKGKMSRDKCYLFQNQFGIKQGTFGL